MYLYIKALHVIAVVVWMAGLLSCHDSLPMTLMLRLAVCIRGNVQGDGITALQVDHAADDDRHLADQQWVSAAGFRAEFVITAALHGLFGKWVNRFRHVRNKRQNNSVVLSMRYRRFHRS
jgi:hypothetical protein